MFRQYLIKPLEIYIETQINNYEQLLSKTAGLPIYDNMVS